jgi:hypothetical protein
MKQFWGQASWAKMISPAGKLPNKEVNKAEELTQLSTNIVLHINS